MILRPGHNVWRMERAERAAVVIDGAAYFRAVREALLKARRTAFIVGWDLHSQTRLVGESGDANDGYPPLLAEFLCALVEKRPSLAVHLLLWDYAMLYAGEREWSPRWALDWNTPPQIKFRLDDAVPLGAAQHQKLIIVDDAVAFAGGLDITVRRWDTPTHQLDDPRRVDPAGKPYRPFHDVQALVDGPAARALAEIARARWDCTGEEPGPPIDPKPDLDPWPDSVRPTFTGVDVGIARTQPAHNGQEEVREVEALFLDSIEAAQHSIYVENQFLTCTKFAARLVQRMRKQPRLEAVFITPQNSESWLEARTMRNGRIRFAQTFIEAGLQDRVRLLYPEVTDGVRSTDTMIHAKMMVIDDQFLRVGSANLNYRSMGTDTECDVAIEAKTEAERMAIADTRNRLVAEHCGVTTEDVAAALERRGSLVQAVDSLSGSDKRLRPISDGKPDPEEIASYIDTLADPERPISFDALIRIFDGHLPQRPISATLKIGSAAFALIVLVLAWHLSPLADLREPELVREQLTAIALSPWAPLIVVASFVCAGLVAFPVTVLIAATAAAFGPVLGFAYAAAGAMASAIVTYAIGAKLGRAALRDFLGPRLNRIRTRIAGQGLIAVAAIRLVPVAPFTVVNLVAGASEIRPFDYIAGTMLGLAPGLITLSLLGYQVMRILAEPTPQEVALLAAAIAAWIGISIGAQLLVSRFWSKTA